jgi:hypothetical protein
VAAEIVVPSMCRWPSWGQEDNAKGIQPHL